MGGGFLKISLDTCILFDALSDTRIETLLRRLVNDGNELYVPLTVAGELVAVCLQEKRRNELFDILNLCGSLGVQYLIPRTLLRECCMCIDEVDDRLTVSSSDRTHLAYAKAWESDYFLTTDQELCKIPMAICDSDFKHNRVISPDGMRGILGR